MVTALLYDGLVRRSACDRAGRLRGLSETDRDLVRLANEPGYLRWRDQIRATGGCARPVYLSGHTTTVDPLTGLVVRGYDTRAEPGGRLAVRCRNRRASRCGPCSREHSGDTFHLVRAGLLGGKSVPATVADHPRLFVTLTAPSFGPVHRAGPDRCRPRRDDGQCEHGDPQGCPVVHPEGDPMVGQPLCPGCYDYASHVLWHAHVGELWNRTTRAVRRQLATAVGITQAELGRHARVSFAKVAEYQGRGAVHFHAVVRLDGPTGPDSRPPSWATADLLADVVRGGVAAVRVGLVPSAALGEYEFRWGAQLDVHAIQGAFGDGGAITDEAVAAYVAKYVSKSVGDCGGLDHRIRSLGAITLAAVSAHLRALMGMCWHLGGLPELEHLRLRAWAHTLGYRGHCLSKSRRYSTTYAALRVARAAYRAGPAPDGEIAAWVSVSTWRYVGSGHTLGEAEIAAGIAADLAELRELHRWLVMDAWPDG
ncbi:MAG: plasmid replication initiator protein [Streptomyces sp.]|nr:plasmid replication initiator protein [Streptomyces sp.]